jgi:hypothetical protein
MPASDLIIRGFAAGRRWMFVWGWGPANLLVTSQELTIFERSSYLYWSSPGFDEMCFARDQVVGLRRFGLIPIYWGIEIDHNRRQVPARILFLLPPWRSPEAVLQDIKRCGFSATGSGDDWTD